MFAHDDQHDARDEQAEAEDDVIDIHIEFHHQCIQHQHRQHRQVLVEILHRDRMASTQQHVPTMLQQCIHRHQVITGQPADDDQQGIGVAHIADQRHRHDDQAHAYAERQDRQRFFKRHETGGCNGTDRDADGSDALQDRRFVERHMKRFFGPFQNNELQRCRRAPEQGGDGERDLTETVVPQHRVTVAEVGNQSQRAAFLMWIGGTGLRNLAADDGRNQIQEHDDAQRRFGRRVDAGVDKRKVEGKQSGGDTRIDESAAEHGAKDNRDDRQAFDPAIGGDQFFCRKEFGQDAVLGRRICRRAKTDDGIGQQRMYVCKHHGAADDFYHVRDEHDPTFWQGIGKGAHECGQEHIRQDKKQFQKRRHPGRRLHLDQQCNRCNQ